MIIKNNSVDKKQNKRNKNSEIEMAVKQFACLYGVKRCCYRSRFELRPVPPGKIAGKGKFFTLSKEITMVV